MKSSEDVSLDTLDGSNDCLSKGHERSVPLLAIASIQDAQKT